ncbi:sensor histidine kinase [Thermopolyspora sp. NPDC052614]|uniref:sensor histidine kinase n=1 Tax=Thermopolyspora sp. NPDC052614 TaxID=3155682 RepID=UPI003447680C
MRFQGARGFWRAFRRPRVLDITLVALLELFGLIAIVAAASGNATILPVVALLMISSVFLLARRKHPFIVTAIVMGADLVSTAISITLSGFGHVFALYSVGRYASGVRVWVTTAVAAIAYGGTVAFVTGDIVGEGIAGALGPPIYVGLGQLFRLRHELRERRIRERAERAVQAERRRIARELHDVVAHHISVINVLVGAGRTTMTTDPERAQEVLVTAERTAREAMTEMRQLLHVLRAEDADEPDNHAGVGTAALPALVEQSTRSGIPARLEVTGEAAPLPATIDHAVYRIVQEALTNTRKHAPGARASVRLAYLDEAVEVEVLDDGSAAPGGHDPGYGLGGMAERVALCGGQLQTGRRPEGGFRVHARIPVPADIRPTLRDVTANTANSGVKEGDPA